MVSALQRSLPQIGKSGTQAIVNTFGTNVIAAYSVSSRFEDYAMVPLSTIAYAMTTFIAQNIGVGTSARVRRSIFASLSFFPLSMCWPLLGWCMAQVDGSWAFTQELAIIRLGEAVLPYHELDLFCCAPWRMWCRDFSGEWVSYPQPFTAVLLILVSASQAAPFLHFIFLWASFRCLCQLIGWIAMTCYELPKMISFLRGKEKGKRNAPFPVP